MTTRRPHLWTGEAIIAALQTEAAQTGEPPTRQGWDKASPEHPAARTVYDMFGSWPNALRAAGFIPRKPGKPTGWTPARVKQALYHAAYKLKRVPTAADMKRLSRMLPDEFPSVNTVVYHLGSWNNGLMSVGYAPHRKTTARRAPQHCPRCDRQHWGFQTCPAQQMREAA